MREPVGDLDVAAADELLTTTRAVRRRLDLSRPVPRSLLLECVAVAQQAPTPSNTQSWHYVFVTDPKKRRGLAEIYRSARSDAVRSHEASDSQTARVLASADVLVEALDRVPVHVVPCLTRPLPAVPDAFDLGTWYAAILPAAWSFLLAARARGLGGAWTTQTLRREADVAELLGLPPDVRHVALLPLAYYLGTTFRPAERPDPDTISHWDEWTG